MFRLIWILPLLLSLLVTPAFAQGNDVQRPKLLLTIVIDQFRADYLTRFSSRFLPAEGKGGTVGGFSYLMNQGAYYPLAEYSVLQNMTGPGHSMILSGSLPYQTGIPINTWYDAATGESKYCVADEASPIIGGSPGAPDSHGVSPRSFLGTTVGDELKNAGHSSRVVTLAIKERAAVLLGGKRADLALWIDPPSFRWVTSKYYLGDRPLPDWVQEANRGLDSIKGGMYKWLAMGKPTGLSLAALGDFERNAPIGGKESLSLPLGVQKTTDLAISALQKMKLGMGKSPDVLALSYSSHDYLGHQNGPNTLDMEEITVVEDREIARLLNTVKKTLPGGLKDVVIVLTADHGVPPSASWLAYNHMDAGKIGIDDATQKIEDRLNAKFGKAGDNGKWIAFTSDLNFYLNPKAVAASKVAKDKLEHEAKQALLTVAGAAYVFTESEYQERKLPPGMHEKQILRTFYPGRSGDLVMIPKPFYNHDEDPISHHSGYTYDRTVPLIISWNSGAGSRVKRGMRPEHADVIDIAPTLSYLLGTIPPVLSEGRVLSESLQ
jgi:predicted AlkP superfamily pyrophosphatase or phosphodiesterase